MPVMIALLLSSGPSNFYIGRVKFFNSNRIQILESLIKHFLIYILKLPVNQTVQLYERHTVHWQYTDDDSSVVRMHLMCLKKKMKGG